MIHQALEGKLRSMGLTGCYQGYACLVHAALLVHQDPALLEMPTKLLYPQIARLCRLPHGGVDQAIRTAIQVCCRLSAQAVQDLCGTVNPTVQQFLVGLSAYCGEGQP